MHGTIHRFSRLVVLAALTAATAEAQTTPPPPIVDAQDTPFVVTTLLATAGSYAGLQLGVRAAFGAGLCGEVCFAPLLAIPLVSAAGAWLGARAVSEEPSFAAALGGAVLGMGVVYVTAEAFDDYRSGLLTYASVQGLMTALSTLR